MAKSLERVPKMAKFAKISKMKKKVYLCSEKVSEAKIYKNFHRKMMKNEKKYEKNALLCAFL